MFNVRRRELIALLGSAAAAWPLATRAQQGERTRRVGMLTNLASDDQEGQTRIAAFLQGLQELGWKVGRNVRINYRWGAGNAELYRKHAAELLALEPDVIVTNGTSTIGPVLQTTRTVPVVLRERHRPGRQWLCGKPGTARRHCDRFRLSRIRHGRKMA